MVFRLIQRVKAFFIDAINTLPIQWIFNVIIVLLYIIYLSNIPSINYHLIISLFDKAIISFI